MSFILPLVTGVVLFGSTFDLRRYQFKDYRIYDFDISQYVEVTNIDSFTSEFFVINAPSELRKVLGLDVVTGLKVMTNNFPYEYSKKLDFSWSYENDVKIVLKLTLRTVSESIPYNAPTKGEWKTKGPQRVGSHYVKSIIYGADRFFILSILSQNQRHKNNIAASVSSRFGKAGIFDSSFKENFDAILEEHETGYTMSSFGTVSLDENFPPRDVEAVLALKDNFQEIIKGATENKGFTVLYEMQSLSFLDPGFPLVEINGDIIKILEEVELKFEDLAIAYDEYLRWLTDSTIRLTTEDEMQMDAFADAANNAKSALDVAIWNMDVTTTSGDINQFEDALNLYGERSSNRKYRDWLNRLKENINSRIAN